MMRRNYERWKYEWILAACVLALCAAPLARAQANRDYLSSDEVEQVREAQEPNARIQLFLHFAQQRLDQIEDLIANGKPGRSALIHDLLDQYQQIVDGIGTVGDDALHRHIAIDKGNAEAVKQEKVMLAKLQKIEDSAPKDLSRYEFVLKEAIDTTSDGIDLAQENLGTRSASIEAADAKEKEEREAVMTTKEKKAAAQENEKQKPKRKAPTLLRPGETLPNK
ncbi:MAG TPA: hypothetical protein VFW83_10490 [Bryobacteraceae bacterium]|nr:hypothetical protein [Bryobacteraceae bacterium]